MPTQLLDQVNVALVATDLHGLVTYINRRAEVLYGASARDAVGRQARGPLLPRARRRNPLVGSRQALAGLGILALFALTGIVGPLVLPHDPSAKVGPVFQAQLGATTTLGMGAPAASLTVTGTLKTLKA